MISTGSAFVQYECIWSSTKYCRINNSKVLIVINLTLSCAYRLNSPKVTQYIPVAFGI